MRTLALRLRSCEGRLYKLRRTDEWKKKIKINEIGKLEIESNDRIDEGFFARHDSRNERHRERDETFRVMTRTTSTKASKALFGI